MMEISIADFHTSFYITDIKIYRFIPHTYVSQGLITVETLAMKHSNVIYHVKMCCVVVIMIREWQLVLYTKYSLNNMAEIYLCLLKVLHWSTLVHQHRPNNQQHHKNVQIMMCFTHFFLMKENNMLPRLLHTSNASLYC